MIPSNLNVCASWHDDKPLLSKKQLAHSYHQEAARVSPVGGVGNPLLEQREPLSENIFKKFFNEPIQVSKNINVES